MRGSAAAGPGEATGSTDADLQPYLSGSGKAPIPTYFIGSYGSGSTQAMQALSNATGGNLHYLGRAGLKTLTGLNIAFLDGTFDQTAYQSNLEGADISTGCAHYTQVIPARCLPCIFTTAVSTTIPLIKRHIVVHTCMPAAALCSTALLPQPWPQ